MATEPLTSQPKRGSSDVQHNLPNKKRSNFEDYVSETDSEDATMKEELEETKLPSPEAAAPKPRNAFSELMAPTSQPKPKRPKSKRSKPIKYFAGRDGLGAYLADPASLPASSRVIFHTESFVAIHDLYPKATVHCLLLPRTPAALTRLHPFEAFTDPVFLASARAEALRLAELATKELRRLVGSHSASEAERNAILDGKAEPALDAEGNPVLPEGRDWGREIRVGVHAVPSMNHLHIHVISRDMHSEMMKHRKHYNSFNTDFFVPLEDFPLSEDDERRRQGKWPERPMVCWRCGKDFGNRFKDLKDHLEVEFEQWKGE